jgi:hypothetical protein
MRRYGKNKCTVSHIVVTSPQVSWLFFKARAKRPSRPIFASCFYGHSAVGAKMERDGSSEQRGKTANWPQPGGLR